ncbi:MAG: hypothetical protein EA400_07040 [Chromatiaceae bacterium]|nr:MAG: hypothetical protein EA400_07040 [Chromatiaceae bacterium]
MAARRTVSPRRVVGAVRAFERFANRYQTKYPTAIATLFEARAARLACSDFPAVFGRHLRSKLAAAAAQCWRRIRAPERLAELLVGPATRTIFRCLTPRRRSNGTPPDGLAQP